MKTISNSILTDKDPFIIMDTGPELSMGDPFKVKGWGVFLCTAGSCRVSINTEIHNINPACEMLLFPEATVCFLDCAENLNITIFCCSEEMMSQALRKISTDFFRHIRKYPVYQHSGGSEKGTKNYFELFRMTFNDHLNKYRTLIATNILRSLMLNIYDKIEKYELNGHKEAAISRSEEIYKNFLTLLQTYGCSQHNVAFYADKLCITSRYLSAVTYSVANESPKHAISEFLIREAKVLLTFSELSVQQISDRLHFPDPSHFGRFFRRMTGITPLAFRKTEMVM